MDGIDLKTMSAAELKQLRKELDKAITKQTEQQRRAALAAAEAAVREFGFSLTEIAASAKHGKRRVNPAKYVHPEDPEITWSGRGRKPRWFKEALAKGRAPWEFEIGR